MSTGLGRYIIEYYGPGLNGFSAMDRHVMANMGTEMGATTTVFPSDGETRRFLESQNREAAWTGITADPEAEYDRNDALDLSALEPLIALPGSPGNVHPVREVRGRPIHQSYIGSSANPGLRDFRLAAAIVKDRLIHPDVSFDINPSTRQVLENMTTSGALGDLLRAGARLHQTGCNGCIGMGQAPATGRISLRTVPRNFPGRSGTQEDQVYLCSPETAAASALTGEITDPRDLEAMMGMAYPRLRPMENSGADARLLTAPPPSGGDALVHALEKGPNIKALPAFPSLPDSFRAPVILKMGNDISTDEILQAGAEALPLRSNIPAISRYAYAGLTGDFPEKAKKAGEAFGGHLVVAGSNYAQGSSREHAALAPRYLGQIAVIAKSYARIGWQNLVNFGILPLEFRDPSDYDDIVPGNVISCNGLRRRLAGGVELVLRNETLGREYAVAHRMSPRQVEVMLAGGVIGWFKSIPGREAAPQEALTGY